MTTIAYKDGVMAADSLSTCNGIRNGTFPKVHAYKILTGGYCLIGFCGEPAHITKAIAAIVDKNQDPRPSDSWPEGDYMALIVIQHDVASECPPDIYVFEGQGALPVDHSVSGYWLRV